MRIRDLNFAIAIAVSLAAHLLLWPLSRRLTLPPTEIGGEGSRSHGMPQVTLVLNGDGVDLPKAAALPPKSPEEAPEDNMGEANGKGTGAQQAKGDKPLQAREADQDQAYLGKHQPGSGRDSDLPILNTDPRGQDGIGGQRGRPQVAQVPPTPSQSQERSPARPAIKAPADPIAPAAPPRPSPVKQPDPAAPTNKPADAVTPPESKTASVGAAKADVNKKPIEGVKPTAPLAQTPAKTEGVVPAGPVEGPPVKPVTAISTAPPTVGASIDKQSVVVAPKLPLRPEVVAAPPPPAVEESKNKSKTPDVSPAKAPTPPVQIASAATPALVGTGDGLAPGRARPSADPSQLSDTESDPFQKHSVTAVLRDGRLEVRDGRKVKTTRPQFLPGAFADFIGMQDPKIVLKIEIDANGKVTKVIPKQGTGSVSIDFPCERAVYDWWFEPAHDAKGLPKPDSIEFTIQFR